LFESSLPYYKKEEEFNEEVTDLGDQSILIESSDSVFF
jgi:hypothetical protein